MVTPVARRAAVRHLRDRWSLSERSACRLASYSRSSYRRMSLRAEVDEPLRERLLELATERPRFGYRRLHVMLCREVSGSLSETSSSPLPAGCALARSILQA